MKGINLALARSPVSEAFNIWILYEEFKKLPRNVMPSDFTTILLGRAITLCEEAFHEYARDLDENTPENEFFMCQLRNDWGYYLAERGQNKDSGFARDCATYIEGRRGKYPRAAPNWDDTIEFIRRKFP